MGVRAGTNIVSPSPSSSSPAAIVAAIESLPLSLALLIPDGRRCCSQFRPAIGFFLACLALFFVIVFFARCKPGFTALFGGHHFVFVYVSDLGDPAVGVAVVTVESLFFQLELHIAGDFAQRLDVLGHGMEFHLIIFQRLVLQRATLGGFGRRAVLLQSGGELRRALRFRVRVFFLGRLESTFARSVFNSFDMRFVLVSFARRMRGFRVVGGSYNARFVGMLCGLRLCDRLRFRRSFCVVRHKKRFGVGRHDECVAVVDLRLGGRPAQRFGVRSGGLMYFHLFCHRSGCLECRVVPFSGCNSVFGSVNQNTFASFASGLRLFCHHRRGRLREIAVLGNRFSRQHHRRIPRRRSEVGARTRFAPRSRPSFSARFVPRIRAWLRATFRGRFGGSLYRCHGRLLRRVGLKLRLYALRALIATTATASTATAATP